MLLSILVRLSRPCGGILNHGHHIYIATLNSTICVTLLAGFLCFATTHSTPTLFLPLFLPIHATYTLAYVDAFHEKKSSEIGEN